MRELKVMADMIYRSLLILSCISFFIWKISQVRDMFGKINLK